MFDVEPWTGNVVVIGPLSTDYAAISYFQVLANNTQAPYQVHKTDVGTASLDVFCVYLLNLFVLPSNERIGKRKNTPDKQKQLG